MVAPANGTENDSDVGYALYDLFDLGEFDQKGSVRRKYRTKDEYLRAIKAAQDAGIRIYADVVLNHKLGADAEEEDGWTDFRCNAGSVSVWVPQP